MIRLFAAPLFFPPLNVRPPPGAPPAVGVVGGASGDSARLAAWEAAGRLGALTAPVNRGISPPPVGRLLGTVPKAGAATGPTLQEIHEAGRYDGDAALVLAQFAEYRTLSPWERRRLEEIWIHANRQVVYFGHHRWAGYPEFTDPANPLAFDLFVADETGASRALARLHHELRRRLAVRGPDAAKPLPIFFAGSPADLFRDPVLVAKISRGDREVLARFLERLPTQKARLARVGAALKTLATGNDVSLPFVVRAAADSLRRGAPIPPTKVSERLQRAATFYRRYSLRFRIEGPIFPFYLVHAGDNAVFVRLVGRLREGAVERITFDEKGGYEIVRKEVRPEVPDGRFSYREAAALVVLPRPATGWGERELLLRRSDIADRIRSLFGRVERRLGRTTPQMMRFMHDLGFADYYAMRRGDMTVTGPFLSDRILEAVGLEEGEKELLRHLETLLRIAIDRKNEPKRGPYAKAGLLLRYWRFFSGKSRDELEKELNRDETVFPDRIDVSLLELGWVSLQGPQLLQLAGLVGVPRVHEEEFVGHLCRSYAEVGQRWAPFMPRGGVDRFSDPEFAIPFFDWEEGRLLGEMGRMVIGLRGSQSRPAFARRIRRKTGYVVRAEIGRTTSAHAAAAFVDFMRRRGDQEGAARFHSLWAALELKRHPVAEDGSLLPAACLLRFARYLLLGPTCEELWREIAPEVSVMAFRHFETGRAPMPRAILERFATRLIAEGVFSPAQGEAFVGRIVAIYRAMGVRG